MLENEVPKLLTKKEFLDLEKKIKSWFVLSLKKNSSISGFERDLDETPGESRWFIRLLGEDKDIFTIRLMLRQRMFHYETYVMPAPEDNSEIFYKSLLTRNRKLVGATFCVGEEEAIFLIGSIPSNTLDESELDRIIGTLWAAVEQNFRSLLNIGFVKRINSDKRENK